MITISNPLELEVSITAPEDVTLFQEKFRIVDFFRNFITDFAGNRITWK